MSTRLVDEHGRVLRQPRLATLASKLFRLRKEQAKIAASIQQVEQEIQRQLPRKQTTVAFNAKENVWFSLSIPVRSEERLDEALAKSVLNERTLGKITKTTSRYRIKVQKLSSTEAAKRATSLLQSKGQS